MLPRGLPCAWGLLAAVTLLVAVMGCAGEGKSIEFLTCVYIYGGDCPDSRVRFFMYTPLNPTISKEIIYDDKSSNLLQNNFNASLSTKILIHGYNSNMGIFDNTRREYMERNNYNLVLVDWSPLVRNPCYIPAVHNARFVGRCVADVVNRMRALSAEDIHIIGFSLGAHVPAFAANTLKPWKAPRITGLDPAMPLFITSNDDEKLDPSDATFVDVVHTNAFVQGKPERSGHIDFYMNGGITQPGCKVDSGCNHLRAVAYFTESLRSARGFWGWPCGGLLHYIIGLCPPRGTAQIMGEDVDHRARGFYIVTTNAESPFARGPWQPSPAEFLRSRAHLSSPPISATAPNAPPAPAANVATAFSTALGMAAVTIKLPNMIVSQALRRR